jgi:cell division protein FtsB
MSQIKDKLKLFFSKLKHGASKVNKYWLVVMLFLGLTFTTGDSSLYQRYQYDKKIRKLENEIRYYKNELETASKKLHDLNNNKEGLERFAREEYLMKKENEDLYIIKKK